MTFAKASIKKLVLSGSLLMFPVVSPMAALAAAQSSVPAKCTTSFLGLIPWYAYLKLDASCAVTKFTVLGSGSDLPLVALAIIDDLVRIAGLAAVGFVIYGGIMYTTSQGEPEGTAKAQSTILNALIGLAVAVTAVTIVSYIGSRLQ